MRWIGGLLVAFAWGVNVGRLDPYYDHWPFFLGGLVVPILGIVLIAFGGVRRTRPPRRELTLGALVLAPVEIPEVGEKRRVAAYVTEIKGDRVRVGADVLIHEGASVRRQTAWATVMRAEVHVL